MDASFQLGILDQIFTKKKRPNYSKKQEKNFSRWKTSEIKISSETKTDWKIYFSRDLGGNENIFLLIVILEEKKFYLLGNWVEKFFYFQKLGKIFFFSPRTTSLLKNFICSEIKLKNFYFVKN